MYFRAVILLAIIFCHSNLAFSKLVNSKFKYKLYTSDVFPWINGSLNGIVRDNKGKMAKKLEVELKAANESLSFAVYGISNQQWLFSFLENADINIKFVVDQKKGDWGDWDKENFTYEDTSQIPEYVGFDNVIPDLNLREKPRASSIMHNKFVIIDKNKVWLGSTNLSHTGIGSEYNANTSILIESYEVAMLYKKEFNQMFNKKKFSTAKNKSRNNKIIKFLDNTEISVYFSPQDNVIKNAIIPFILNAKKNLHIAIFYLTDLSIVEALIKAKKRGVDIKIIYDALAGSHPSSKLDILNSKGIKIRVENWGGKMHMKTAISDGQNVLMGSMNWTKSGNVKNDENVIVINKNKGLALKLETYFRRLWKSLDSTVRDNKSMKNIYVPRSESFESINSCYDGLDNDHDGKIDFNDSSCIKEFSSLNL